MASKNQADLESQKPVPPAAAVVASAPTTFSAPASGGSAERTSGSVVVGISDRHHAAPETQPLLAQSSGDSDGGGGASDDEATQLERAMAKTFRSTAELAKHLPTGAVLVFEVLSPVFTNSGKCDDVNRVMTAWLVGLCAAACFFLCFTDSFLDAKGIMRYVVATRTGLWVIDGTPPPSPEEAAKKSLKFIDFFHAFLSLIMFMSVAMFDRNVDACFNPVMSYDTRQVLTLSLIHI
ncbi:hypothetical protein BAE44_0002938 [Dichanthelium oligosanthes]|uniref:Uncharacterized protein n=1 Tax=Dichanthelium oligosanthes TaxID=888268 RepID=A0A1E5WF67_9POAL|nr:hypothetical protein BAE44_0002938 [Dichanthelium oligosanthes]